MRIGAKKRPFYRIVAIDGRSKRNGSYLELLGTYNPLAEPKEIKLEQPKIDLWIKKGAQMSDGFLRIIGKAAQRPPRKPKKAKKEAIAPKTDVATPDTKEEGEAEAGAGVPEENIVSQEGQPEQKEEGVETSSGEVKEVKQE